MAIGAFTTSKKAKKSATRRSGSFACKKAFKMVSSLESLKAS